MSAPVSTTPDSRPDERGFLPALLAAYALVNLSAYGRDATIASSFGATGHTDAYFVGTFLPTLLTTILVLESLIPAFLPPFTRVIRDQAAASRLTGATISVVGTVLLGVVAAVYGAAGPIVQLAAGGWKPEQVATAASVLRISDGAILFVGVGAVLSAAVNASHSYLTPAIGMALSNATVILLTVTAGDRLGIEAPAWGFLIGGGVYLCVQVAAIRRIGLRPRPSLRLRQPLLGSVARSMGPMLVFAALAQNVPLVERWLASSLPGGQISYLVYASKLMMSPILVVTAAGSLVAFVAMSHASGSGDREALRQSLGRTARLLGLLLAMATVAIITLRHAVVGIALQRGQFGAHDADMTSMLLAIYALGLIPNGLAWLLVRSLQSQGRYWQATRTMLLATACYVGCAVLLFHVWRLPGLALSFAVGQIVLMLLLYLQQPEVRMAPLGAVRYASALFACSAAAFGIAAAAVHLIGAFPLGRTAGSLVTLAIGGMAVAGTLSLGMRLLGIAEGRLIVDWLRARLGRARFSRMRPQAADASAESPLVPVRQRSKSAS